MTVLSVEEYHQYHKGKSLDEILLDRKNVKTSPLSHASPKPTAAISKAKSPDSVKARVQESKKLPKYRNKKVVTKEGLKFDSEKEYRRYLILSDMQKNREITDLQLQEEFPLIINGQQVCYYRSDFSYFEKGVKVVEDVKSKMTRKLAVYRLKKKLMFAINKIEIKEV